MHRKLKFITKNIKRFTYIRLLFAKKKNYSKQSGKLRWSGLFFFNFFGFLLFFKGLISDQKTKLKHKETILNLTIN